MKLGAQRFALIVLVVVAIGSAVLVFMNNVPPSVTFRAFNLAQFTQSLAPLLVISLLIERTIEVFFGVWRQPDDQRAASEAATKHEAVRRASATDAVEVAAADAAVADSAVANRKADNTRLAFLIGGSLGLLVALAGARTLSLLVDDTQLAAWQRAGRVAIWWQLADVFLTAGLLGGGADGFHHITAMMSSFLQATQKRADDSRKNQ